MHRLAQLLVDNRPAVARHVARSFPRLGKAAIDDIVSDATEQLLLRAHTFDPARSSNRPKKLVALFRVVAWRSARAQHRSARNRSEVLTDDIAVHGMHSEAPEVAVSAWQGWSEVLAEAIHEAVAAHGGTEAALWDRFVTGDSDTAVAARHGVHRSILNRGKRHVQRRFQPC